MDTKKEGKNSTASSACSAFIRLIGDSKWTSRRVFSLWSISESWKNRVLRSLQTDGLVTCLNLNQRVREQRRKAKQGGNVNKGDIQEYTETIPTTIYGSRYTLTKKGREFLRDYNPNRYLGEDLTLTSAGYDERKIYRLSLLSETRAMSELAGFSVHPDTKPDITALSSFPLTPAGRPACSALTKGSFDPERFQGVENSIYNQDTFRYYDQNERVGNSYIALDTKNYPYRETPIGCVYLLPELQKLARMETEYLGLKLDETDMLRYSRSSGVFFSGNGPYILYNTERTALRLRKNGEAAMRIYINAWAGTVYKQSLTLVRPDVTGKQIEEQIAPEIRGSILFGDETFTAAVKVIEQTIKNEMSFGAKRRETGSTQNYNLRMIPDTYFLPVIQEAIPLYALMAFPHWNMHLQDLGFAFLEKLKRAGEAPGLTRDYITEGEICGELEDGSTLVILIDLHLDMVRQLLGKVGERYTVIAMEWQKPFFDAILEQSEAKEWIRMIYLPQQELEVFVENLHRENELPYRL